MKKAHFLILLLLLQGCNVLHKDVSKKKEDGVIAHRGAWRSGKLPQNSVAALQSAIALKCYGSEFDVHLTKDNVLVLNHDHDFFGLPVEHSTYQELLSRKLENGEFIPTAESFINTAIKQKDTKLIMELKPSKLGKSRSLQLAVAAVALVNKLHARSLVEYISFDYDILKKIVELDTEARVAYLGSDVAPQKLKEDGFAGLDYHHGALKKNSGWIAEAKKLGLSVNVWTVNSKDDIRYFLDQGVDFITTDEPELAKQVWREIAPSVNGQGFY
ncbi:MAG: glycerophosphodiester phosphodiesterase [Pedobacter sp.]|nr:MAG: glycerophosphodiester phosphodiesterase [Pedobacter sp.]